MGRHTGFLANAAFHKAESYLISREHPALVLGPRLSVTGIISHQHFHISSLWFATLLLEASLLSYPSNQTVPGLSTDKMIWLKSSLGPKLLHEEASSICRGLSWWQWNSTSKEPKWHFLPFKTTPTALKKAPHPLLVCCVLLVFTGVKFFK